MPGISRNEGYRRGLGKEAEGIAVVSQFLANHVGVAATPITDPEENYREGDLRTPSGRSVEVKRQPIDPIRYKRNFVEVFEVTSNARHEGGLKKVATILDVPHERLVRTLVQDRRAGVPARGLVGDLPQVSVSIESMTRSAYTAYINPAQKGTHLYVYESRELVGAIRAAVIKEGFVRGAGMSNDDTFAVMVPLARMRWSVIHGQWEYVGGGGEDFAVRSIRKTLV